MKRLLFIFALMATVLFSGCQQAPERQETILAATTATVAELAQTLVEGTDITVRALITEPVSCLHDYTLSVSQMKILHHADAVVINGLGMEAFMDDVLKDTQVIDASADIQALEVCHEHEHEHHGHAHEFDAHIWLDPMRAAQMTKTMAQELAVRYPAHADTFEANAKVYCEKLEALVQYGKQELSALTCRDMVTFHDGFAYFADAFGLHIAASMEVEAGSAPAAGELKEIIKLVQSREISSVFTEKSADADTAQIIAQETGARVFVLDMGMSGSDYITAMTHNIDTVKEALG